LTGERDAGYRSELFGAYGQRIDRLDPPESVKTAWFDEYVRANYVPHLQGRDPATTSVLEIGCSRGHLLAALARRGFQLLHGVDLSPSDVEVARRIAPTARVECVDAMPYLATRPIGFDLILMKAVLEHVPKPDVLPLVRGVASALRPGGMAIVDVPNMDWLFAGHERYMDFTHEGGFTRESLSQVLGTAFGRVEIAAVESAVTGRKPRLRRRLGRYLLNTLLSWSDPEGAQNPIWARNLIGIAHK